MRRLYVYLLISISIGTWLLSLYTINRCCEPTTVQNISYPETMTPLEWKSGEIRRIYHHFDGRLGNMLFQYAAVTSIARQYNSTPCFNYNALNEFCEYQKDVCVQSAPDTATHLTEESNYGTYMNFTIVQDTILHGYLQSYRYFDTDVIDSMQIKLRFKTEARLILSHVLKMPSSQHRVAIHIREQHSAGENNLIQLPDTVVPKHIYLRFPSPFFFENAMAYIRDKHPSATFAVLSDNPEWCEQQTYLQHADVQVVSSKNAPIVDLALIAECDHVILTRGTFGWWGAYLGASMRGGIVVYNAAEFDMLDPVNAEHVVLSDFYPAHWVSIPIGTQLNMPNVYAPNTY